MVSKISKNTQTETPPHSTHFLQLRKRVGWGLIFVHVWDNLHVLAGTADVVVEAGPEGAEGGNGLFHG